MNNLGFKICILVVFISPWVYGQSKNCHTHYYLVPDNYCKLTPFDLINDTFYAAVESENCFILNLDSLYNGVWKIFSSDTVFLIEVVQTQNGNRNGLGFRYYRDGSLASKINYKSGLYDGQYISYNIDGKVLETGKYFLFNYESYNSSRFTGKSIQYWDNANIAKLQIFRKGRVQRVNYWDPDGKRVNFEEYFELWYDCN